jgi:tRNA1Val (adenine37-N6)-methyltransferase
MSAEIGIYKYCSSNFAYLWLNTFCHILEKKSQLSKMNKASYTYDYSQPEAYRFSLDSVYLAKEVAKMVPSETAYSNFQVLDLCSGCGVIGMELHFHRPELRSISFVEVQKEYKSHFDVNLKRIEKFHPDQKLNFQFFEINYNQILKTPSFAQTFDLIVCNPPYFFKDEGLLSPSEFKNRCRFFLDSDFSTLFEVIVYCLKPEAQAYVLIRKGDDHGRNPLKEISDILGAQATVELFQEIRGTWLVKIVKAIKT